MNPQEKLHEHLTLGNSSFVRVGSSGNKLVCPLNLAARKVYDSLSKVLVNPGSVLFDSPCDSLPCE